MKKEDYCKTFEINGVKVDLGIDDYGQCYYVEWKEDGELREMGLGTYNMDYMESMYAMFDEKYLELHRKERQNELSEEDKKELEKYKEIFEKEYNQFNE